MTKNRAWLIMFICCTLRLHPGTNATFTNWYPYIHSQDTETSIFCSVVLPPLIVLILMIWLIVVTVRRGMPKPERLLLYCCCFSLFTFLVIFAMVPFNLTDQLYYFQTTLSATNGLVIVSIAIFSAMYYPMKQCEGDYEVFIINMVIGLFNTMNLMGLLLFGESINRYLHSWLYSKSSLGMVVGFFVQMAFTSLLLTLAFFYCDRKSRIRLPSESQA